MSSVYAATTRSWFDHLAILKPERVSFWQPTPAHPRRIAVGERWYFKELGAPQLLGYGEFLYWEQISVRDLFRTYRGASGYVSFGDLIDAVRQFDTSLDADSLLGNVVLTGFSSFAAAIPLDRVDLDDLSVRFVYLPDPDPIAAFVGGVKGRAGTSTFFLLHEGEARRAAVMRKHRMGQSSFRKLLLDAYGSQCAFTGPQLEETLQAAHIQPYVEPRSNHIANGLLLRADLHLLFDMGLLGLSDRLEIAVSSKLAGRSAAIDALSGRKARLENRQGYRPSPDALRFHRNEVLVP